MKFYFMMARQRISFPHTDTWDFCLLNQKWINFSETFILNRHKNRNLEHSIREQANSIQFKLPPPKKGWSDWISHESWCSRNHNSLSLNKVGSRDMYWFCYAFGFHGKEVHLNTRGICVIFVWCNTSLSCSFY